MVRGGVLFSFSFKPDDIVFGVVPWYIACEVRARIIHEGIVVVNNAPAGAASAVPAGFDRPLARPAQG